MRCLSEVINRKPVTLAPSQTVEAACKCMRDKQVGAILVTDHGGHLLGIFTGRDAVARVLAAGKNPQQTRLDEVMTKDPRTLSPEQTAIEALRLMWDGGFRHLPVVDHGKLVGLVARNDFQGHERSEFDREVELWEHMR